jgi:TonB family protein
LSRLYPEAARRANLQGVVVLDAIIAADGTVVNIRPVSGADALVSAAMDAARWWRFRPYRVQGEPAPVRPRCQSSSACRKVVSLEGHELVEGHGFSRAAQTQGARRL